MRREEWEWEFFFICHLKKMANFFFFSSIQWKKSKVKQSKFIFTCAYLVVHEMNCILLQGLYSQKDCRSSAWLILQVHTFIFHISFVKMTLSTVPSRPKRKNSAPQEAPNTLFNYMLYIKASKSFSVCIRGKIASM